MKKFQASVFLIWAMVLLSFDGKASESFAVYYGDASSVEMFQPFSLLILDSYRHPGLNPLKDRGKVVLGYLSLGSQKQEREHFELLRDEGVLLHENQDWEGNYFVDVRSQIWAERVITKLIPQILREGFDGVFLDNLDHSANLEREQPEKFRGMEQAAVRLVKAIRWHFPDIKIMVGHAYETLSDIASSIDMVLAESTYAYYDFDSKHYNMVGEFQYEALVENLKVLRETYPSLEIYTLDYWDHQYPAGVADIYKIQRANGFIPYVAMADLFQLFPEPIIED